jgi:hypothetical protein
MQEILRRLLDRLDRLAMQNLDVFEPDVYKAMSAAVFDGFLRRSDGFILPERYAMDSQEGDSTGPAMSPRRRSSARRPPMTTPVS